MTVAIASITGDPHADRVAALLFSRGIPVVRLDHTLFTRAATATVRFDGRGLTSATWRDAATSVDLADVSSLWWRRPGLATSALTDPAAAAFATAESQDFLDDLGDLDLVPQLPAPRPVIRRAQYKARQLAQAARLGFELPPTLISNDPDELLDFAAHHGALRLVSKQAGFTDLARTDGATENWNAFVRYTEPITARDLLHVEALRHCPVIVQVEVEKRLELRVTVVGEQVFAVAIHSQSSPRTLLDWRRYDDRGTPHEVVDLPDAVAERCLTMCALQGLRYAAFDLILTPDDRYVFVEVNPNGQYLWLEELTGVPISAAIADELVAPTGLRHPMTAFDDDDHEDKDKDLPCLQPL